jgi:uncharacterized protein YbaR (Trm112 family)
MLNLINQEKIETVFRAFTEERNCNLLPLLNQWAENKKDIFEFFGGNLTLEREFSSSLPDREISELFCDFRYRNDNYGFVVDKFMSKLTPTELKNNKCIEERPLMPNYKVNQKVSKYLNSIIEDESDYEMINGKYKSKREYFSIMFSMFLQSLKFDGVLTISIDPLDYLTMSLNQANWHSCHSNDGCYQAGTLSYMTDKYSVIASVKSKSDVEYDINGIQFTHNSKKWRQVVYIDIDTFSAIFSRQYPADNENVSKIAREIIAKQFSKFFNIEEKWSILRNRDRIRNMIKDNIESPLHYNDILHIDREYTRIKMSEGGQNPNIIIGNIPYCPVCGEKYLDRSGSVLCKKCRKDYRICPDCGEILYINEGQNEHYYRRNEEFYCNSCFQRDFIYCEECQEWERKEGSEIVNGKVVCRYCLRRKYTKCEDCGEYVKSLSIIEYNNHCYCITCYDKIAIEEEVSA